MNNQMISGAHRLSGVLPVHGDHPAQNVAGDRAQKTLESQFAYMMLKAMDQSSPNGGLMGDKVQGLGHFRDLFFQEMATNMVEHSKIGFHEALTNRYSKNLLEVKSGSH